MSRTRAIEILVENSHTAMTVCFYKKVDPKEAAAALAAGKGTMSDREWNKLVKTTLDGEERVMVGHHEGKWDEHRRLRFTEMAKGARLVDPRTIDYIIVGRVKFNVKE